MNLLVMIVLVSCSLCPQSGVVECFLLPCCATPILLSVCIISCLACKEERLIMQFAGQVDPQYYAFRWITLLLTQEFNFPDVLRLWDTIIAAPTSRLDFLLKGGVRSHFCSPGDLCC